MKMNNMYKKSLRVRKPLVFSIVAIAIGFTQSAWSANPVRTAAGKITVLEAGWAADTLSVKTTAPLVNPAACPIFNAGYVTSTSDPGRRLYHDILRDAFWRGYSVELLISGTTGDCPFGKPRIISVMVRTSF